MNILGIETSCDETAASIVLENGEILSNIVLSQVDLHKVFGGVIPELASRKHLEALHGITKEAVFKAGIKLEDIDLIAVTSGPGLIGALLTGISYAKGLAYALKKPIVGVNHIEAHLYANFMENKELTAPCIGLVISGGHTTLLRIDNIGSYKVLGQTLDDAAGEAFDKVAKLLGLGYPGGPIIDKLSREGNPKAVRFPRAMVRQENYNFSLSGLKTSVVYCVRGFGQYSKKGGKYKNISTPDLVASFQEAVIDQLLKKTLRASEETGITTIVLGGGVARNSRLRHLFGEHCAKKGLKIYLPSPIMCTDNAAMIAGLGLVKYRKHGPSPMSLDADPRMGLE